MSVKFVSVDRETPRMLPARVEDYVPEGHLGPVRAAVVEKLDLSDMTAACSERGSRAYHPSMDGGLAVLRILYGDVFEPQAGAGDIRQHGIQVCLRQHQP